MKKLTLLAVLLFPSISSAQTFHIVAAGVDTYEKGQDKWGGYAQRVTNILASKSEFPVKKHVFTGPNATKSNVLDTLAKINPKPDDVVGLYLSAHGSVGKKRGFFVMTAGSDKDMNLALTGKEIAEAINKLPCRCLVIIDTCQAGGMLDTPMPKATVICACSKTESAYGNNLVIALRKGIMDGEADTNRDGKVTHSELANYVPGKCTIVSKQLQHPAIQLQQPVSIKK